MYMDMVCIWIHVALSLHLLNLMLTVIISDVHPSCVGYSREDPHVLHFLQHHHFSSEGLYTLMDAIIDCAVLYCGHATANLKNGTHLSTLVVIRTYRIGVFAHTVLCYTMLGRWASSAVVVCKQQKLSTYISMHAMTYEEAYKNCIMESRRSYIDNMHNI